MTSDELKVVLEEIKSHAERGLTWPAHREFHVQRIMQILIDAKLLEEKK